MTEEITIEDRLKSERCARIALERFMDEFIYPSMDVKMKVKAVITIEKFFSEEMSK